MTIEELCERSYKTAVDKGWHEKPRSFGEVTALFHSEVSEALEIWRDPARTIVEVWESEGGKPEGFVIELADLLIRIGDTCVEMGFPLAAEMDNITIPELRGRMELEIEDAKAHGGEAALPRTIPEWLAAIHVGLSRAYEDFMTVEDGETIGRADAALNLARVVELVGAVCLLNGLDLETALIRKMAYNDTRPQRHGGKRG